MGKLTLDVDGAIQLAEVQTGEQQEDKLSTSTDYSLSPTVDAVGPDP